jgi:NADH-quinone oxidoreductase subunit G
MPRLTIDNIEIEVPAGTNVLEAAKQAGIWIPHFCYHPALGSVGACRLCAVKFTEGPVKGLQMSCMLPAQEGMVVSTTDPEALRMRQLVIEWLMTNHPHDCPVCDAGGECLLQDYTVAGGHGMRRFQGKKRTFINQDLGSHIQHEMNRCIECYRCARYYQEFAGGDDLGVMGSASRVFFGRFKEGELESPFSGNLLDICPTGVYTDKTARFRARYWDYEMAPSVCPWCSLGCNTIPAVRYRELLKTMARRNDQVNGWFMCDRGRFGNGPVNDPLRPRIPRLEGGDTSWDEAINMLVARIGELNKTHGEGCIALVGSPRLALEGASLLAQLGGLCGAGFLCYFNEQDEAERTIAAVSQMNGENAASMADVQASDCIAVLNCDLLDEGPMMALAVRQAWRKGAKVFLVGDSSPQWTKTLSVEASNVATLEAVPFADCKRPVVVCGTQRNTPAQIESAAQAGAKTAYLYSGPNAYGAALLAKEHVATSFTAALATGKVKGVLAMEADIPVEMLTGIPLVAVADWLPTDLAKRADIFLPTTAWVEMDGTFVNNEGRGQRFRQVMNPGLPIKGLDPALHPPRIHSHAAPGSDLRPAWRVIAQLMERLGGEPVAEPLVGRWEKLRDIPPDGEGIRIL